MSLLKGIRSDELYIFHSEYANVVSLYQNKTTTYFLTMELRENASVAAGGRNRNSKAWKTPLTLKAQILFKSQSNQLFEILSKSMWGVLWKHGSTCCYVPASEFQGRAFLYKYISGSGCIFLKQFLKLSV